MKCPIKLSPAVSEFIKKNDLVYVGVGNYSKPIFTKDGTIICPSFPVESDGTCRCGDKIVEDLAGIWDNSHYFVSLPDAKKHFPHCLPKARKTPPKLRYFIPAKKTEEWIMAYGTHNGGSGDGHTYGYDGKYSRPLGFIKSVMACVADGRWREVSKAEALARLTPPAPTELETLRKENASLKARVAELESEKEKLRAKIKALNNF